MKAKTLNFRKKILLIGLLLLTNFNYSQTTQTYNSSNTFIVPAGITSLRAEAWGAGGAGGGNTTSSDGGGGGGGGAYSLNPTISVTSGSTHTVTVGAGGNGGTGNGLSGGDSWFSSILTLLAKGGSGGNSPISGNAGVGGLGGSSVLGVGTTKYRGGNGGNSRDSNTGHGGPGATSAGTGNNGLSGPPGWLSVNAPTPVPTGAGAGSSGGSSGFNGASNTSSRGGGGGGAGDVTSGNTSGGNGANGQVILTWVCPTYALTSAALNNGPICSAASATVTLRSNSLPSGTYNVTYNLSGSTTATNNTASMTFTAGSPGTGTFSTTALNVGTTTVTITSMSSGSGCNTMISSFNTTNVTINTILPASVSISASTSTICAGTNVTFTATPTNGGTTPSYQWRRNGLNVGTNNTIFTSTALNNGDIITCVMTSNASCVSASPATSNAISMTVNALPSITGTNPNSRINTGTVGLGATATVGSTIYWYTNPTGGTAIINGNSFTTPTISTSTTFYVIAMNNSGCFSNPRTPITATVYSPEIDILGNAVSITDGDTTPATGDWTDFGSTDVNTGGVTKTFTINNTGTVVLNIGAILFSGVNPSDFSVTTAPSSTVAVGSSTTFIVSFLPTATGVRTAMLSLANDDSNENSYNFTLQGFGTNQEMDVQGNAISIIDDDTTPTTADWTDFSNITTTRTFTIRNTGTSPLFIGAITFSGTNAADFSITSPASAVIIAGSSSTFTVQFSPLGIGVSTANISITNNDDDENPYNFLLQGTAIDREINIQGNGVSIVNGDTTPTTADWTDFSTAVTSRTFTIQNTGAALLSIGTISFSGANASDFSILTPPSATVAGYSNTTMVVRFSPSAVGLRTATMYITSNDSNENPYAFALQGTGVVQEINIIGNDVSIATGDISPSTGDWTDFSNVAITRTFTIQNTGTMNLNIGAITITGANPGDFSISTLTSSIVAGTTSSTFIITFTPTVVGVRTATINIPNNDTTGNENPYIFRISATSASEIGIIGYYNTITDGDNSPSQTDHTDFGSVSIENESVTVRYTINNTGTGPLVIEAITISGANANDYSVVTAPSASVPASGSTFVEIAFNPSVLGIKNAIISIANNDIDENPFNFSITGIGIRTYIDSDGDGVTDTLDLDDDNDGIVDTLEQSSCIASPFASSITQTFLNETFGTGTTRGRINVSFPDATTSYCYEDGLSGASGPGCNSDWSVNDGEYTVYHMISTPIAGGANTALWSHTNWTPQLDHTLGDTNGRMAIFNADYTPGIFYRTTINSVTPNATINYSFWALNIMSQASYVGSILPNITVEFRDLSNNLLSTYNTGELGRCGTTTADNTSLVSEWKQFSTSVNLGNITSFIVSFINNATGGSGNDLAIDDILITQTYCDWDGDGIANIYDLDSDNDGIPDIEEGNFKQYSNGVSKMDISNSASWTDANSNGMNDVIDPIYTGVNNAIPDTDSDGARDAVDLDSDNDSLFDVDEAIANMGDGDINGDGKGDGVDTDRDGILDIYDSLSGFGTLVKPYTQNSDGVGSPDYLQVDSDNNGTTDIAASLYASLDTNADGKIDGATDVDKDGITDAFDTNTATVGSPRDLNRKLFLDFDGRNDYGQDATALGVLSNASIMAWVDLNSNFSSTGVIAASGKAFQLRINSSRNLEAVVNGSTITYSATVASYATAALSTSQWYHVGAVYNGSSVKLYLNGVMVASGAASGSIASAALTLGKNPSAASNYFKGKIDEVRIFNVALTDLQLQRMVYQEIQNTASQVQGAIVPKEIGSLPFTNVLRYYRMDTYKDDIVDDLSTSTTDTGTGMKIYNNKIIKVQEAPMPFVTRTTGTFATAVNYATKDIRGLDVIDYDYSIIQVKHNITETANSTDLAMFVDPGVTVSMTNDTKIQNDWYLKLDGKIDLQGKSQLVQTTNSELDARSTGTIERDQQGQSNKYNYNYWSSPVGAPSATTNNNPFTVNGVLRDGTDPNNIQNITWTTGYDGATTSPITLSSYWIFKFQNLTPDYANWSAVGQNGTLQPAQGFTMKGTNASTESQNYTFVGKPNNGTITVPIIAGNLNLCGNPYPSALDANAFIAANTATTTGAIYFWEHYNTNTSHNLLEYQGGYAARNLVGGTPPVSPSGISGMGTSSRVPSRYIPVGQGFLVYGGASTGNITFNNNQRGFVKETDPTSNVLFRQNNTITTIVDRNFDNRQDSVDDNNTFAKIRLGFNSANNFHRQILLGFMDELATEGFDPGYDAPQLDSQPNDFYFNITEAKLVIQGVDAFNTAKILPLSVKNGLQGTVKFTLDATENFDDNQSIYIHDNVTDQYHDIRSNDFEIDLPIGTFDTRFSLRFSNPSLGVDDLVLNQNITVAYTNNDDTITIKNSMLETTIQTVELYNMLGQSIRVWDVKDKSQTKIQIPVNQVSAGTYIVKVHTLKGDLNKKIIIK